MGFMILLKTGKLNLLILLFFILFFPFTLSASGNSGTHAGAEPFSLWDRYMEKFRKGYRYRISVISWAGVNRPALSSQNPGNDFLKLADYSGTLSLRPDFSFSLKNLFASVKPRADFYFDHINTSTMEDTLEHGHEIFINEYLTQYQANEKLFFSFGRQVLQWGPSFLCSPSNPFFFDNGKNSPHEEQEGKEFAKIIFMPGTDFTYSIIVNTDNGRSHDNNFGRTYAIKSDYAGSNRYASLILSHTEGGSDMNRAGFFGGITANDALILYTEIGLQRRSYALYPVAEPGFPGFSMAKLRQNNHKLTTTALAGGTYTFKSGASLTFEYLYNQKGYNGKAARSYYKLKKRACDLYHVPGIVSGLAKKNLALTMNNKLMFLRKNYFMVQYMNNDIFDLFDLTFRWTQCLDDKSAGFILLTDHYAGDHTRLFASGILNTGGHETSLGSILDYQILAGIEYIF